MTTSPAEQLLRSQAQFGANAAKYAASTVHAKGASLSRIVELVIDNVAPQASWRGLDIASAAGHTAFAFAPHVGSMVSSDATPEMLAVAKATATDRGISNIEFELADAHALPFADASFDLVTCRIAPHHFSDPALFVTEAARVLSPQGVFALVDNVAPADPAAAKWCDDFERRRDLSHLRCLPVSEWVDLIENAGLTVLVCETMGKRMMFEPWADNMSVDEQTRNELVANLAAAPEGAAQWLRPHVPAKRSEASFVLTEGLFVAQVP